VDSKETLSRVTQPSDDNSSSNAAVGLASGISPESHTGLGKSVKSETHNPKKTQHPGKSVASFTANTTASADCVVCKNDKHPLYVCPKFKSLPHDRMMTILRENKLCMNCLRPGHFVRQCKSLHHCRQCQKPHHTLLHVDSKETLSHVTRPSDDNSSSNAAVGLVSGISPESHPGLVSPSLS